MKPGNNTVALGAAILLLGAAASLSGTERPQAPAQSIPAATGQASLTPGSGPAGDAPTAKGQESPTYLREDERKTIKVWVETGAAYGVASAESGPKSKSARIELGKRLFTTVCALCHQATGQGIPAQFPPLTRSDFLNSDKDRAIKILLNGLQGEVVVNGQRFNNSLPSFPLSNEDVANALTFVYNAFGNSGQEVTPEEVKAQREKKMAGMAAGAQKTSASAHHEPSP
jgi:mono/diheme cytochrome c family protein